MSFHTPPRKQQGQYRYDPSTLEQQGPARIFPYAGEDGLLRYISTKIRRDLLRQGQLSQPWSLLLQQLEQGTQTWEKAWNFLTTQLVDLEIFQSGWFNLDLPPDEQFNVDFVRRRRAMTNALLAAQRASEGIPERTQATSRFYGVLEQHGQPRPTLLQIHQRDGGLSDREFARQRIAGPNPVMLRRIQQADQALVQSWAGQSCSLANGNRVDLVQAAAQAQLFVVDYPLLKKLTPADLQPGRYVGSPTALFYRSPDGLEPLLIQVEPGRVVTASHQGQSTDDWMRAKLFVQVADVTQHELITHLCDTHLAMEAIAIATPRQLPAHHALYRLLRPHFRFLMAINSRGNAILLSEGAAIDKLMAPTRAASVSLINQAYRERSFGDFALPTYLKRQGVGTEFLPEFPYRDDALLLWDAIAKYVTHYLQRYYPNDTAIQQDPYLQAWAAELGDPLKSRSLSEFPQAPNWLPEELAIQAGLKPKLPHYSRIPGFPDQLTTVQQLIDIVTQVIFICGPQHAAVNFSQFDYAGYVPNMPMSAYCQPGEAASLQQLLPSTAQELAQIELTYALSGIRWGTLGSSSLISFNSASDRQILEQFQADLATIEQEINNRNQSRIAKSGISYPYLLPSRIPNSINI